MQYQSLKKKNKKPVVSKSPELRLLRSERNFDLQDEES
jgi:hypothetical protein